MEETKTLDYFRDKDDNYIIRRIWSNEEENNYFLCSGTYSSIFIFKCLCLFPPLLTTLSLFVSTSNKKVPRQ